MGSGSILMEVIEGAKLLEQDWGVGSDVWSAPSFTLLARDGLETERHNRLHPEDEQKKSFLAAQLEGTEGPVIASTDYVRNFVEQVRAYLPEERDMIVLGTDGYGRSDTREALRSFFEVDRYHVVVAALDALAKEGKIKPSTVAEAIAKYGIDADAVSPTKR